MINRNVRLDLKKIKVKKKYIVFKLILKEKKEKITIVIY